MPDFLPDGAEAGTLNVPGICGLAAGLRFVRDTGTEQILRHEKKLCRILAQTLGKNPRLRLYGCGEHQSGVLSFSAEDFDCELLAEALAKRGCAVRAGLHCAPLAHESAGTISCGTVRLSPSFFTAPEDAYGAARMISQITLRKQ